MLTESNIAAGNLELKWADIQRRGYTIQPFLDQTDIDALLGLHHATTPEVPADYFHTAFGSTETRRRVFNGILSIVEPRIERLAPGYRVVMGSFVTKKALSKRGKLGLHTDPSVVNHDDHLGLNVWAPLCDVDDRNGCLRMVDYSHRFGHISAIPPNPAPFSNLYSELDADYLHDVPMAAGSACLFDTRVLHATDENLTPHDRTSVVLNLIPLDATPRLYFWNAEVPSRLEVYNVDSDFVLTVAPARYPTPKELEEASFVGFINYAHTPWTSSELAERIPRPERSVSSHHPPRSDSSPASYPANLVEEHGSKLTQSWLHKILSFGSRK